MELRSIEGRLESGSLVLKMGGEFHRWGAVGLLAAIRERVSPGITKVVLDMAQVESITTAAMAALAEVHQHLAEAGCRLILAGAGPRVKRMLLMGFLDKMIKTTGSVQEALQEKS